MRASRLLLGVLVLLTLLAATSAARARSREVVVAFDVASDVVPQRVCIHVEKLGGEIEQEYRRRTRPDAVAPSGLHQLTFESGAPSCNVQSGACDQCEAPPARFYGICQSLADPGAGHPRELHLKLEHAGIERFVFEGKTARLKIDQSESTTFTPRVEILGGRYHAGEVASVGDSAVLTLPLVPRCVERRLRFPAAPESNCAAAKLTTNGVAAGAVDVGVPALLHVNENGRNNTVSLERCGTTYVGAFDYPAVDGVELAPSSFPLSWSKSCFVPKAGPARKCPSVTLSRYGHTCKPKPECESGCCYQCNPSRPVEFPTPVQLEVDVPLPQRADETTAAAFDAVVWQEDARFPGDTLTGYVASEERRVFLHWGDDQGDWAAKGDEIDSLELTGPDGRTQHVGIDTTSVAVPGVQCGDRFTYRYQGRWPDKLHADTLDGDTLVLEAPASKRQDVIMGLRVHGGALGYTGVDANAAWSPFFDVEFAALIHGGWEVALSGIFSPHPSSSTFAGEAKNWEFSALARVLVGVNYTFYPHERVYASVGAAGGIAFPALASSWKDATEYPLFALRARGAYEITRATALELGGWVLLPEQYVETVQDAAGPRSVESRLSLAAGISGGLQWSDVF